MTDFEQTLLQKASGETRLKPDEQRYYMGTFEERVVATADFDTAKEETFQKGFPSICQQLHQNYPTLTLKIAPNLSNSLQMEFLKQAKGHGIAVAILQESLQTSPFALLFHTDHAVEVSVRDVREQFSALFQRENDTPTPSFWASLFGKK